MGELVTMPTTVAARCDATIAAEVQRRAYRDLLAAIVDDPRRVARLDDLYARSGGVTTADLSRSKDGHDGTPSPEPYLRPRST